MIRAGTPNPPLVTDLSGQAFQARDLNFPVAANPRAPNSDRAVALCWVMHVVGDMHQPLHTASLFPRRTPMVIPAETNKFVVDPATSEPVTLHWLWDDAVHKSGEPSGVVARAREIEARYSRASLPELRARPARNFSRWSFHESFPLLAPTFPESFTGGIAGGTAPALPPGYAERAKAIAEWRIAIAGYRLADLARATERKARRARCQYRPIFKRPSNVRFRAELGHSPIMGD